MTSKLLRRVFSAALVLGGFSHAIAQQSVNLNSTDTVYGIGTSGTPVTNGGLDGEGSAFASNLLGTSISWSSETFQLASPGPSSATSQKVITLPAGADSSLSLLAVGVNGNQANQVFVVTYTDGTTSTFTQSLSNWNTPQSYSGESIAATTAYKITASGATHAGAYNVYGYSFALNSAKTVKTLTLPANRNVVVLAADLTGNGSAPVSVNLNPTDTVYGIGTSGTPVTNGGLDGEGSAFASNLLGTSISWSSETFQLASPGPSSATSQKVIALPAGTDSSLSLLAVGVNGNQANQVFVVTYTDGTTSTFTQSLSNWNTPQSYSGESIAVTTAYKITASGATHAGAYNVYGYSFALNSAKTVKTLTLPANRNVVVLAADLTGNGSAPVSVNLNSTDTVYGIGTSGTPVTNGGLDGEGSAFASNLLGTSISWSSETFQLASAGPSSATSQKVITLPAGTDSSLSLLAVGVNGNQANQVFVVTYTDGTTSTFTQSLSNWNTPQSYSGESIAATTAYKITASGATHAGAYNVYGYSFALNSAKTVKTLTLPANRNVVVLAADLTAGVSLTTATPTFSPTPPISTSGSLSVSLTDSTAGAAIYYTLDNSTPTTSSTRYSAPITITATTTINAVAVAPGYAESAIASGVFTITSVPQCQLPQFSPGAGTYPSTQTVTISDATSGSSIFFTTDGSTPTTSSTKYTAPFKVSTASTTIKAIATASGCTTSAVASATYLISTPAPTNLSYPTSPPLLVGKAVSLSPTVTGTVTAYAVSPALPAGLTINATTGVISGTPSVVTAKATYMVAAANVSGTTTAPVTLQVDSGPTVHLSVTAATSGTSPLTYQWKTTDGTLLNTSGAQTDWLLPQGHGIHFAYVVIANGTGGFTETHIGVNSGSFGGNDVTPPVAAWSPPASTLPVGTPMRFYMYNVPTDISPPAVNVAAAGALVRLFDTVTGSFTGTVAADGRGIAVIQNVPISSDALEVECAFDGESFYNCGSAIASTFSPSNYQTFSPINFSCTGCAEVPSVVGSVFTTDGVIGRLGFSDPFFGINAPATVALAAGSSVNTAAVNDFGDFTVQIPPAAVDSTLQLSVNTGYPALENIFEFEAISSILQDGSTLGNIVMTNASGTTSGTGSPTVSALTATYNGNTVASLPGPAAAQPSDTLPERNFFIAFKGVDDRLGACKYYQAIGAVPAAACDNSGNYTGAINFESWKNRAQIDGYAKTGAVQATANFVNAVDLNLARGHHSVAYPGNPNPDGSYPVAAYVCNHPGPLDASGNPLAVSLPPTPGAQQNAVDTAVANSLNGQNRVACVAMDYTASAANGGKPFTSFYIFGPQGQLLPSVNLDGRGEKFVPGACVVCHGGDHYAGSYAHDGSGPADVGGHWLPYDVGNFAFSDRSGYTDDANMEAAIKVMNTNVLGTSPTPATLALINGWYANRSPTQIQSYVPPAWSASTSGYANAPQVYQTVIARSCRTCHSALPNYAWDLTGPGLVSAYSTYVCGGTANKAFDYTMPNTLAAFNRFWNSVGATNSSGVSIDQPAAYSAMVNHYNSTFPGCTPHPAP